ncbi:MAG: hypothetical protein [Methanosarcina spindle-shaped virus 1]
MKIYNIAMFLLMVNLAVSFLVSAQIFPVQIATVPISEDTFKKEIPDDLSYSNADIGMYIFGDFPRALGMLIKIFVLAPVTLSLLLSEVGFPGAIVAMIATCMWAVYLTGVAQIIMKFPLEGSA